MFLHGKMIYELVELDDVPWFSSARFDFSVSNNFFLYYKTIVVTCCNHVAVVLGPKDFCIDLEYASS